MFIYTYPHHQTPWTFEFFSIGCMMKELPNTDDQSNVSKENSEVIRNKIHPLDSFNVICKFFTVSIIIAGNMIFLFLLASPPQ